jgi:hypothetical protein
MKTIKNIQTKILCSRSFAVALLGAFAAAQPLHALTFPAPEIVFEFSPEGQASTDADPYVAGTAALNEQRWPDAVKSFDLVINGKTKTKSKRVDAALYWKAYALKKLNQSAPAIATCNQLKTQFADSTWNKECTALNLQASMLTGMQSANPNPNPNPKPNPFPDGFERPEKPERPERPERPEIPRPPRPTNDPDADIKILALNSLLHQDPARAIPVLRDILNSSQPDSVKKQAIFVLAQSKAPEAQSILHDAVTGKMNPTLQRQAIQMMAVFQGKSANDTLVEVYRSTTDPAIKKSIISAIFITHDAPRMVELARNEKDLEVKRSIVSQLALMNDKAATDYMLELLK